MNILEAYKAAKKGQTIVRKYKTNISWTKTIGDYFTDDLRKAVKYALDEYEVTADDWEVLKTPHKEEMTMRELMLKSVKEFPYDAKVTIEWED